MKGGIFLLTAATLAQQVAQPAAPIPQAYAYNQQAPPPPRSDQPQAPAPVIQRQEPIPVQVQQQQQQQQQQQYVQQPNVVSVNQVPPQQNPGDVRQQQPGNVVVQPQAVHYQQQQPSPVAQNVVPPVVQYSGNPPAAQYAQAPVVAQQAAPAAEQQQPPIYKAAAPAQPQAAVGQPPMANKGQMPHVQNPHSAQINDQAILAQQMAAAAAAARQQAAYQNVVNQQPVYVNQQGVPVVQPNYAAGAMNYDHPYAAVYNNAPKVVGVKPAGGPVYANQQPMVMEQHPQPVMEAASNASSIAADWDKHMQNFMPQMILTFRLSGGEAEHFHQDVSVPGTLIRGGYFESTAEGGNSAAAGGKTGGRRHVGFKILSPSGKLLFSSDKAESLFRVDCEEVGTYTFAVSSASWAKSKFVTFVMGTGEVTPLTGNDISSIDGNIKMLYRMLSEIETHNNLLWTRHRAQAEQIRKTSNKTYYAFIIELLCTAAAIVAQLATVKKMISRRSMF